MVHFKTSGEAPGLAEGWYRAKLTELEERESQNPLYPAPQVIWHFELTNSKGELMADSRGFNLDFWVFTSQSIGPKSNARPIMEALLDGSINSDDNPDELAEKAIDKTCYVKIADYYSEDGEPKGSRPVKGTWTPLSKRQTIAGGQRTAAAPRPGPQAPRPPENTDDIPF